MRKFLLLLFLVMNSFIKKDDNNEYFEPPFNPRLEALGGTGMTFGEDYGSFYLAPTSMFTENIDFQLSMDCPYFYYNDKPPFYNNTSTDITVIFSFFLKSVIGNFFAGLNTKVFENIYPLAYSLEIYNFSFGFGYLYSKGTKFLSSESREYASTKISVMYKSVIGNFSLLLNNFPFESFNDPSPSVLFDKTVYSIPNLRIGYGKEFKFKLDYTFDKIYLAFEMDNLLMKSLYFNSDVKDYNFVKKIRLGIEGTKNINEFAKISIRAGLKNFLPTFGIGINLFEGIRFEYAFTNKDFNDKDKNEKFLNVFSVELKLNNIYIQKARKFMQPIEEKK